MKNTIKLVSIAAIALSITSCGNDKKNETENDSLEPVISVENEVANEPMGNPGQKELETSNSSTEMRIDKAALSFKNSASKGVWDAYNAVRVALIASDAEKTKQQAANLAIIFDESNAKLKSAAEAIAITEDLDAQRKAFSQFSNAVQAYFRKNINAGTLYKQHCPMALNGKGADWLSNESTIENPYYGDKMMNCGSVTATITK
ncbi:DUF3347 domain-containing protein [Leeuwenhoekiella aequorea]|jgi:hypothetical protein|uniref:DUF3347 domain-containing protein n=1 Tax=Leeuwenhoekiella aequorea TaxID=283736 RepID=A0A4Q0PB03_9FLAO|nr:DUF3347 domain-containing protein [Leeuwenhoekiella aequorea]RXG23845.1 putative protein DUF3347 [Leeuwenhoekiella aequorea]